MASVRKFFALTALLGSILVFGNPAFAGYPEYNDIFVNDFDNVFSVSEEEELRGLMQRFKSEAGIEAVIVTTGSYVVFETGDPTFESFATGLFNSWGVGDAVKNNGIMILLSVSDRVVRIELGSGYSSDYDSKMQKIIDTYMLPAFKQNRYYDGILDGTKALYAEMTGDRKMIPLAPVPGVVIGGGIIALFLIAGVMINKMLRYRPRKCRHCGAHMKLLPEDSDDGYLQKGQINEESVRSVDYDVWKCSSCSEVQILKYGSLFSFYRYCPSCSFRTVHVSTRTITDATYDSSGTGERTFSCSNCGYHKTEQYTIPRKTRSSSSSSSGSFGGGSSSGGGASGRW